MTGVIERIKARQQAEEWNRTKAPSMSAVTPEQVVERFFVEKAKVQLNPGRIVWPRRRQSHAHEPGDVAADDREGADEHGQSAGKHLMIG